MLLWFGVVIIVIVTISKFMFICIWKSMRPINDDLMVRIAVNQAVLSSILMCLLKSRAQVSSVYNVDFKSNYEFYFIVYSDVSNKQAILSNNPPCSLIKDFRVHRELSTVFPL